MWIIIIVYHFSYAYPVICFHRTTTRPTLTPRKNKIYRLWRNDRKDREAEVERVAIEHQDEVALLREQLASRGSPPSSPRGSPPGSPTASPRGSPPSSPRGSPPGSPRGSPPGTPHPDADNEATDSEPEDGIEPTPREVATRARVYDTLTAGFKLMPAKQRLNFLRTVAPAEVLKGERLTAQLAKDIGVDPRSLLSSPPTEPNAKKEKYDHRRHLVYAFLLRPDHGYQMPGKKDCMTIEGKVHQKIQLVDFLHNIHAAYMEEHPDEPVSLSFFREVRRQHKYIRPVYYNNKNTCLCIKHQNFSLLLECVGVTGRPDTIVRETTLPEFTQSLQDKVRREFVTCETWQSVDVEYGNAGKTCKKTRLKPDTYTKVKCIEKLSSTFVTMREHSLRAQNQHRAVRLLRNEMPASECTIQMDFAENWMVSYPMEPQSTYYAKEPVTLHPAVIHYRDSTGELQHMSLALVTDDRKHDAGSILAFIRVIVQCIHDNMPHVKIIHYVSDSPLTQYRNISIFSILSKHTLLFGGLEATWTYFEAGHGKGPCDGIGAVAKRNADYAVKRNFKIKDAQAFADQGNSNSEVVFYSCVPVGDVKSAREQVLRLVAPESLIGTLQFHAVVPAVHCETVAVRTTSCFGECCWKGGVSVRQCDGWSVRRLFDPEQDMLSVTPSPPATRTRRSVTGTVGTAGTAAPSGRGRGRGRGGQPAEVDAAVDRAPEVDAPLAQPAEVDAAVDRAPEVDAPLDQPTRRRCVRRPAQPKQPAQPGRRLGVVRRQPPQAPAEPTRPAAQHTPPTPPSPPPAKRARRSGRYLVPPHPPPQEQEVYGVGDTVACVYDRKWYLGTVQAVQQDGEYEVKFLWRHRVIHSAFSWPPKDDILDIAPINILMKTPALELNANQVLLMDKAVIDVIDAKFLAFNR